MAGVPVDFAVPPVSDEAIWAFLSERGLAAGLRAFLARLGGHQRAVARESAVMIRDAVLGILLSPDPPTVYRDTAAQLSREGSALALPAEYGPAAEDNLRLMLAFALAVYGALTTVH